MAATKTKKLLVAKSLLSKLNGRDSGRQDTRDLTRKDPPRQVLFRQASTSLLKLNGSNKNEEAIGRKVVAIQAK